MKKINQEEYEILKGLDDKWKWIARDERHNSVCVHSLKPIKEEYGWTNIISEYNFLDARYFQFIQWEDEEPCNISELIEEYESEETEVKKDLEWLKRKTEEHIEPYEEEDYLSYSAGCTDVAELILGYIDQVEQPETLSQEWIDDHEKRERLTGPLGNVYLQHVVPSMYLQNLLVPKQEVNLKIQELIEKYEQEDGEHSNPENAWIDDFIADLEDVKHFPKQEELDRAYKDGYEKGKQHTFYKGYLEGLSDKENEPETVADVISDFWKSFERLKEVMSMEVKELEE